MKLILVFGDQLGIAAVRELRFIFLFDLGDQLVRIFAVTVITVVFGALYVLLVFGDYTVKLIFEPFLFAFVSSGFDFSEYSFFASSIAFLYEPMPAAMRIPLNYTLPEVMS